MASKSRRRKRSSSRSLESHSPKSVAKHGINFFALVLGLTAASLAIFLVWNLVVSAGKPEAKPKKNPTQLEQSVVSSGTDEFDSLLAGSDVDQLWRMYEILEDRSRLPESGKDLRIHLRRVAVIDRLFENAERPQRRELAASHLMALKRIYQLRIEYGQDGKNDLFNWRKAATRLSEDRQEPIAVQAQLALIEIDAMDSSQVRVTADRIATLVDRYPDDGRVISSLRRMVEQKIMDASQRQAGLQLAATIVEKIDPEEMFEYAKLSSMLQDFQDWTVLGEQDFFNAWEARSFSGDAGYELLRNTATKLAQQPTIGPAMLQRILEVGAWFEYANQYKFASEIYEAINDNAARYQLPSVRDRAQRTGAQGIKRCDSMGKKIELVGTKPDGSPIKAADYQGRVVVLMYFSYAEASSVEKVFSAYNSRSEWLGSQAKVLVIVSDRRSSKEFSEQEVDRLASKLRGWDVCVANRQDELPLFDQCPSQRTFRIAVLNKQHEMSDVHVSAGELRASISYLQTAGR